MFTRPAFTRSLGLPWSPTGVTTSSGPGQLPQREAAEASAEPTVAVDDAPSPEPPGAPELDATDPRTALRERLLTVLLGLPAYFEFNNHVAGVEATDLHALNTLLGASIEGQVVKALNQQRKLWDPDDEWLGYTFERQSQRFPDVLLTRKNGVGGTEIALGIELKGWFLLAKEGVPRFRFATTPAACADHDLLVVVPWYLDNVLSGSPVAGEPWVRSARWAAEYRNYYWQHLRKVKDGVDVSIDHPEGARPYPSKDAPSLDAPGYDKGGNFGRVARTPGLMDEFIRSSNDLEVLGIRIGDWNAFLRIHSDQANLDDVSEYLAAELRRVIGDHAAGKAEQLASAIKQLLAAWEG